MQHVHAAAPAPRPAASGRARPTFVAGRLPLANRRPVMMMAQALLLAAALLLLLGFYNVVEGAVARGPAKPVPVARAADNMATTDAAWQCETPTLASPHSACRRVDTPLTARDALVAAGSGGGLQRVSFGR